MSFKREGNDKGMLDNLRKRRVAELFGEVVPENEAKLLCNGRLACLVCGHRPVFDTVNMLMVHRQGKKHAASKDIFLRKKKEVQALIAKRKHEQYMKDGTTAIRQASTSSPGIIGPQPYDPRVKKTKTKPYDRKPRLDLRSESDLFSSQPQSSAGDAASSDMRPFSLADPQKHSHQLKNIFQPSVRNQAPVIPYIRQNRTFTDFSSTSHHLEGSVQPRPLRNNLSQSDAFVDSQHSEPFSSLSSSTSSSSLGTAPVGSSRTNFTCHVVPKSLSDRRKKLDSCAHACKKVNQQRLGVVMDNCANTTKEREASGASVVSLAGKSGSDGFAAAAADTERKTLTQQKYYHLSGSGWKKDWDGKWIRDEEAEFDSDEEPPDLP